MEITRRHFSGMTTAYFSDSTSYIVNKFEHVWKDGYTVRPNLNKLNMSRGVVQREG